MTRAECILEREAPTPDELREMLRRSWALWTEFQAALSAQFAPLSQKWSYSGKAFGWSLQLKQKERTVLYMIPCRGHFVASLALGEKACRAARAEGLPEPLLETIERARKYSEGRGVRLEVRNRKSVQQAIRLATLRMSH